MATDIKNDATLSTSLISHWELEETSGTRFDSHGSNDLADNATVGYQTGIQGNGALFEPSTFEYLSIARGSFTGLSPGTGSDISFSFWWYPHGVTLNGGIGIFPDVTADNEYICYIQSSKFKVQIQNTGTGNKRVRADTTTLSANNWYHFVFSIDSSTGDIAIWINGTSQSLTTENNNGGTFVKQGTADFYIGRWQSTLYFDGAMDEISVWNKIITSGEVADLYNSGSGIPYDAGGASTFTPRVMMVS